MSVLKLNSGQLVARMFLSQTTGQNGLNIYILKQLPLLGKIEVRKQSLYMLGKINGQLLHTNKCTE